MATKAEYQGRTPAGGIRSVLYYRDDDGNPVDESVATNAEGFEYDTDNHVIRRTYFTFKSSSVSKSSGVKHITAGLTEEELRQHPDWIEYT